VKIKARPRKLSRRQPTSCEEISGEVAARSPSDPVKPLLPVARLCFQSGKTMGEVTMWIYYPEFRSWKINVWGFSSLRTRNPTSAKLDFHNASDSKYIG
jgi:hypothetical protein